MKRKQDNNVNIKKGNKIALLIMFCLRKSQYQAILTLRVLFFLVFPSYKSFFLKFNLWQAWNLYERGMHIELVDDTLNPNEYDEEEVKKIIEIGLLCTQAYAEVRPSMSEVLVLLQGNVLIKNMKPSMPILIEN